MYLYLSTCAHIYTYLLRSVCTEYITSGVCAYENRDERRRGMGGEEKKEE